MDQTPQTSKDLLAAIYEQVTTLSSDVVLLKSDMGEVKKQVKYTNGKVAGLMEKDIRREEREKTLKETATPTTVINAPNAKSVSARMDPDTFNKLIVGLAALLAALGIALNNMFGGGK